MHPSPIILARCITSKYSTIPAQTLKSDGSATISNESQHLREVCDLSTIRTHRLFTTHLGSVGHIFYFLIGYTKLATNQRLFTYNRK
jgi:hypothetical protein